jgi:hypothetical protein
MRKASSPSQLFSDVGYMVALEAGHSHFIDMAIHAVKTTSTFILFLILYFYMYTSQDGTPIVTIPKIACTITDVQNTHQI